MRRAATADHHALRINAVPRRVRVGHTPSRKSRIHRPDRCVGHLGDLEPDECEIGNVTKDVLDELHKRKIDMSDEILVLNVGGYIGNSTRSEIAHAEARRIPVSYLEALDTPTTERTLA